MADKCRMLEGWPFYTAFPNGCWVSDAITHETETHTRALQLSLSTDADDADVLAALAAATGYPPFLLTPELAAPGSASDADNPAPSRIRSASPALHPSAGKISKRKSRASRQPATTFIAADPANFRQMVQQVTGVQSRGPHPAADAAALAPEPWGPVRLVDCLPTLDTSALLLERGRAVASGSLGAPSPDSKAGIAFRGTGFDSELPLPCFPTLESWGVI